MDHKHGFGDDGSNIPDSKHIGHGLSLDETGDIGKVGQEEKELLVHRYALSILKKELISEAHSWKYKPYGKYKLYLGKFMIQPIRFWWKIFMTATFVVGITFLFEIEKHSFWIGVFGLLIFVLCIASTIETMCMDPGIIKRPEFAEAVKNLEKAEKLIMEGIFPPTMKIRVKGKSVLHGYCKKCHHFRPPFSGHCNSCDCCILNWNQHCDITGGCIGDKNWVWSQIMALSYTVFYIFMFISGAVAISSQYQTKDSRPTFLFSGSIVVIEIILIIIGIFTVACVLYWIPETKEDRKAFRNFDRFPPLEVPTVPLSVIDFMPDDVCPFSYSEYGKRILEQEKQRFFSGKTNSLSEPEIV